jgi:hypothetical protein
MMKAAARWLCSLLEAMALRKIASGKFKDDAERETVRRLLATVRNFRGELELRK